jgi:hypothetical protein
MGILNHFFLEMRTEEFKTTRKVSHNLQRCNVGLRSKGFYAFCGDRSKPRQKRQLRKSYHMGWLCEFDWSKHEYEKVRNRDWEKDKLTPQKAHRLNRPNSNSTVILRFFLVGTSSLLLFYDRQRVSVRSRENRAVVVK